MNQTTITRSRSEKLESDMERVLSGIREIIFKKHGEKSNVQIKFSLDMVNGGIGPVHADISEKISIKK